MYDIQPKPKHARAAVYDAEREEDKRLNEKWFEYARTKYPFDFTIITDPELDKRGVDIVAHLPDGSNRLIEIKSADKYRDTEQELSTFNIELTTDNNKDGTGWFLHPDSLTEYYLFEWFRSDRDIDNIYKYEGALISKAAILQIFKDNGIDVDDVIEKFKSPEEHAEIKIRTDDDGRWDRGYIYFSNGIKACKSYHLSTHPLNIILPKELILSKAEAVYTNYTTESRNEAIKKYNEEQKRQEGQKEAEQVTAEKPKSDLVLDIKTIQKTLKTSGGALSSKLLRVKKGETIGTASRPKKHEQISDGDRIVYFEQQNQPKTYRTIATYRSDVNKWVVENDSIKQLGTLYNIGFMDKEVYEEKIKAKTKIAEEQTRKAEEQRRFDYIRQGLAVKGTYVVDYCQRHLIVPEGDIIIKHMQHGERLVIDGLISKADDVVYNKAFGVFVSPSEAAVDAINSQINIRCVRTEDIEPYMQFADKVTKLLRESNLIVEYTSTNEYAKAAISFDNFKKEVKEQIMLAIAVEQCKISEEKMNEITEIINPEIVALRIAESGCRIKDYDVDSIAGFLFEQEILYDRSRICGEKKTEIDEPEI